jgi:hypothetical protein
MKSNGDGVCNGGPHQNPNASSFVSLIFFNNLLRTCLKSLFSLNFWAMGIPMEKMVMAKCLKTFTMMLFWQNNLISIEMNKFENIFNFEYEYF